MVMPSRWSFQSPSLSRSSTLRLKLLPSRLAHQPYLSETPSGHLSLCLASFNRFTIVLTLSEMVSPGRWKIIFPIQLTVFPFHPFTCVVIWLLFCLHFFASNLFTYTLTCFRELIGMRYAQYPAGSTIVPDGLIACVPKEEVDPNLSDEFLSVEDY